MRIQLPLEAQRLAVEHDTLNAAARAPTRYWIEMARPEASSPLAIIQPRWHHRIEPNPSAQSRVEKMRTMSPSEIPQSNRRARHRVQWCRARRDRIRAGW